VEVALDAKKSVYLLFHALTAQAARNYSFAMAESNKASGADLELKRLEKRLDELVTAVHRLKSENRALRQRQESLAGERTSLLSRNEQVRARVEAMVGRLKSMEQNA
jgi:cell division protein ZapB